MKHRFPSVLAVGAFGGLLAWTGPCEAQTITVPDGIQNQSPQNPQAGQLQRIVPTLGVPGSVITPETTSELTKSPSISSPGTSLGVAVRRLPGMSGGPPLKAPMGAQDPSARYMRPPVIGPLFCDPSINIVC